MIKTGFAKCKSQLTKRVLEVRDVLPAASPQLQNPIAVIAGDYEVIDQPARVIKPGMTVYVCAADR